MWFGGGAFLGEVAGGPLTLGAGLALDGVAKGRIGDGIVKVGEEEVLPHEHAELVAEVPESRRLGEGGTGDAHKVEARGDHLLEDGFQSRPIAVGA